MSRSATANGNPLKVGVDLRHITRGASGGVAPQITETFRALIASCPDWQFHIFGTMFNQDLIPVSSANVTHYTLPLDTYYPSLQGLLDAENIDVLYRPFPNGDELTFPLARQIIFIPDLQHEFFPEFFDAETLGLRRTHFNRLITGCGAVATNSDHAASTIRARYRNAYDDIFLMQPASQVAKMGDESEVSPAFAARIAAFEPFFFFPANIWQHKNHAVLLDAFRLFKANDARAKDYSLLLTGHPKGWQELAAAHASEGVHHLGFVSRAELAHLYRHAKALTFMSLFEGFGMPVLEAFGNDCPVICSNTTSLPEVVGDAALLCDPTSTAEIAARMSKIASNPARAQELIEKGRKRIGLYTWERAAQNLKQAFERVAVRQADDKAGSTAVARKPLDTSIKVSIVTPSYNQGRFLKRTIESVLNQTYPNIELIVMDGGSKDESVEILKSYGDRFQWVSEKDKGQTDAINKGLKRATGRILAYLNSDDTLELDAVETIVRYFTENPDVDLVYGDAHYIDVDDNVTGRYLTAAYSFDRLVQDCCVCQPATFWRSSVVEKFGLFDDTLDYTMDYDYWLRVGRGGGTIRHLPVVLASSRLYPETKTMSARGLIYREIFMISQKHAGRVSKSYVQGYWNHRLWERHDAFARIARGIPHLEKTFVEYDSARLGDPAFPRAKAVKHVIRKAGSRVKWKVRRHVKRLSRFVPAFGPLTTGVTGVYDDNWLTNRVRLSPSPLRNQLLILEGRAPRDTILKVKAGKRVVAEYKLEADTIERLEIPGSAEAMEFTFSSYTPDKAQGRRLSFHVKFTNCFSEEEV
ncbi:glycosyltransferase [Microvirga sp. 2MCAF38]|uniref:glycosyltransferase n=1 Tax=Microvirga sp. 2MCAF38 TaxID=3232989 RepID=UPI003F9B61D7